MKKTSLVIAPILLVASFAFAHGNEQHVIGTVSKVTESSIAVTTTDGKSVEVAMTPQTTFTKQDKTITAKEIKEGDRVVIHAKKTPKKLEATTVQIGSKPMGQMNTGGGAGRSRQPL
jgi:hypothetical protein